MNFMEIKKRAYELIENPYRVGLGMCLLAVLTLPPILDVLYCIWVIGIIELCAWRKWAWFDGSAKFERLKNENNSI